MGYTNLPRSRTVLVGRADEEQQLADALAENLLGVPDAEAFVAPDQSALEAMLAEMTEPTPA